MSAPRDVVRPPGLTLEALDQQERMANTTGKMSEPGEFITDANGHPLGVEPSTETTALMVGAYYTTAEVAPLLAAEGLTLDVLPERWPSLRFIESKGEGEGMSLDELLDRLSDPNAVDENGDLRP